MISISVTTGPALGAVTLLALGAMADDDLSCVPIKELYGNGEELCETMWDDAFEVVNDDATGYVMNFYDGVNPNDAVSKARNLTGGEDNCFLADYNHKEKPGPEDLDVCVSYSNNACCKKDVMKSVQIIKELYGAKYHWDRCGPLSQQCEAFFYHEACFYECDHNAGYWRKYVDASMPQVDDQREIYIPECNPADETVYSDIDPVSGSSPKGEAYVAANAAECGEGGHNRWTLYKAPIKRSYCNGWYEACKNDLFCGEKDGSYFQCALILPTSNEVELSLEAIIGIAVAGAVVVFGSIAFISYLIIRESRGKPIFMPLAAESDGEDIKM